tara:strand:+ start:120 stop:401 length:282 start_codon:yes stop_codon:yes gene_type:complete
MSKMEQISLRIFGRDMTLACPTKEKDNLIEASKLLNEELEGISDKNNALIIAGLTLANKIIEYKNDNKDEVINSKDLSKIDEMIEKIEVSLKS